MNHRFSALKLTQAAMIAALAYIGFQFLRIDIPVGTERTAFHLGNTFVVLGVLLLGGWGGAAAAVGLTIADLTGGYATSAPKTLILKLAIAFFAWLVSRKLWHIEQETSVKRQSLIAAEAAATALGLNVVLDPFVGYLYKTYIFGIPQEVSALFAKIASMTTLVNAILSAVCVVVFWTGIYPPLRRGGLLAWNRTKEEKTKEHKNSRKADSE